jgi:hypothetical protein
VNKLLDLVAELVIVLTCSREKIRPLLGRLDFDRFRENRFRVQRWLGHGDLHRLEALPTMRNPLAGVLTARGDILCRDLPGWQR